MKLLVFAVFDSKAEAFMTPFFTTTAGQAVRSFGDAVNDPQHAFSKHSEDYALYQVGIFDGVLGRFEPMEARALVLAVSLLHGGDA